LLCVDEAKTVLAGIFYFVHGFVGKLDKLLHVFAVVGEEGDSDTCPDDRLLLIKNDRLRYQFDHLLRNLRGVFMSINFGGN